MPGRPLAPELFEDAGVSGEKLDEWPGQGGLLGGVDEGRFDVVLVVDESRLARDSEQPVHPGRGFGGREQVRTNWSAIFEGVPDFAAELLGHCEDKEREWSEWRWTGTRADSGVLDMAGVLVLGVRDGRIAWGRLYIEPVEAAEENIDSAVRKMTGRPPNGD